MNTTINMDLGLLKQIIRMDTEQLYEYLFYEMRRHYTIMDTNGFKRNFLYCEGELPIMVIAHLDTVFDLQTSYGLLEESYHDYPDFAWDINHHKSIYHDKEEGVMWSPDGLGADDRVGVFMIVSLVRQGLRPHILFTTDEETGSLSGTDFAHQYKNKIKDYNIKYLMELDRSGYNDCVFYNCDNPSFVDYIESFGFFSDFGSFTDISAICPVVGIAGVNLSVGYYNEHSKTEMIDLFTMSKNFDIIYEMVEKSKKIKKSFKYIPKKKQKTTYLPLPKEEEFDIRIGEKQISDCEFCKTKMVDYLYAEGIGKVCLECYVELYG